MEISQNECEEILRHSLSKSGTSFDAFDLSTRLSAVTGLMVALAAMQDLGWRIAPPLISVSDSDR